jgi:DNA-directed RNA polymerase subunit RPC12/RpoP
MATMQQPTDVSTPIIFPFDEVECALEEYAGFCIKCGEQADGIEPDAREYRCESCGQNSVYGAGEILFMGLFE